MTGDVAKLLAIAAAILAVILGVAALVAVYAESTRAEPEIEIRTGTEVNL